MPLSWSARLLSLQVAGRHPPRISEGSCQEFPFIMRNSIVFLAVLICLWSGASGQVDLFDQCKARVERILNGTESFGPVNNETIEEYGYIYRGPVAGLHPDFPRERLLTITVKGK